MRAPGSGSNVGQGPSEAVPSGRSVRHVPAVVGATLQTDRGAASAVVAPVVTVAPPSSTTARISAPSRTTAIRGSNPAVRCPTVVPV